MAVISGNQFQAMDKSGSPRPSITSIWFPFISESVGCAPPRTTISGRRRLTWNKDLMAAPAPGGRSFRRSGPCRPSREGTAGFKSDPTHQKTGVENGRSSSTVGDSIASALRQTVLRPRQDKQQRMRGCEGIFQKKRKTSNAINEEANRGNGGKFVP